MKKAKKIPVSPPCYPWGEHIQERQTITETSQNKARRERFDVFSRIHFSSANGYLLLCKNNKKRTAKCQVFSKSLIFYAL